MQEWKRAGTVTSSVSSMGTIILKAGIDTIGGAPLKFITGASLTTPEDGAVEYDGTNYFVSSGGNRYTLTKTLTSNPSLDFGSTASGSFTDILTTVTGAVDGDAVVLGIINAAIAVGVNYTAWISGTNSITVRFTNNSGGPLDPPARNFRVSVLKY
jgi:hypothetical protein